VSLPCDVILADQDREFCAEFAEEIARHSNFRLASTVHDGYQVLQAVEKHQAQLLVMDLVESDPVDAFEVLQALRRWDQRPKSIILSACAGEAHIAQALTGGARYYIMKPFDMPTVMLRLTQLAQPMAVWRQMRAQQRRRQVELQVTQLLQTLGVPPRFSGFAYLQQAITMVVEDPSLLGQVTKMLYPTVAVQCSSSWSKVERSMRHAVESTWIRGDLTAIQALFGHSVDLNRGKPTNSSFIARLADHVRMQMRLG
jgi:two-component system response regulator (stage 0 sporulation protein A)